MFALYDRSQSYMLMHGRRRSDRDPGYTLISREYLRKELNTPLHTLNLFLAPWLSAIYCIFFTLWFSRRSSIVCLDMKIHFLLSGSFLESLYSLENLSWLCISNKLGEDLPVLAHITGSWPKCSVFYRPFPSPCRLACIFFPVWSLSRSTCQSI
jgi:hypothetical protein